MGSLPYIETSFWMKKEGEMPGFQTAKLPVAGDCYLRMIEWCGFQLVQWLSAFRSSSRIPSPVELCPTLSIKI